MMKLGMIFDYCFMIGLLSFLMVSNHFLNMLISLEFIMMSIYFITGLYSLFQFYTLDFQILYLSMMIMEGVFGLCILIYLSRFNGSDLYFSLN